MAMLAEPRQRKRYNLVPRGKALYEDDNRFGTKMLEKMGWEKGKGLGAREDGSKDFVRVRYKNDILGLGFEHRDDQWTQHEQSFNGLLKTLNNEEDVDADSNAKEDDYELDDEPRMGFGFQDTSVKEEKKPKAEKLKEKISGISLEERSKQSRARVHYKKFTRGKDLAQYSEKDLANIFGKKAADEKEAAAANDIYSQISSNFDNKEDGQIINTGVSINDYFQTKMEAKKSRKNGLDSGENGVNGKSESNEEQVEEEETTKKKKKKSKKEKKEDQPMEEDNKEQEKNETRDGLMIYSNMSVTDYFKLKMEAIRNKKNGLNQAETNVENTLTNDKEQDQEPEPEVIKKKKKNKKEVKDQEDEQEKDVLKEKKLKKNKNSQALETENNDEIEKEDEVPNKKSKKSKKAETIDIEASTPEEDTNTKKKDKTKKKSQQLIEEPVELIDLTSSKSKKRKHEKITEENAISPDTTEDTTEQGTTQEEPTKKKKKKNKNKEAKEIIEIADSDNEEKPLAGEEDSLTKKKKTKNSNENTAKESSSSTANQTKTETVAPTKPPKVKRKDVSAKKTPFIRDINFQILDLDELKKKYQAYNIYPISSFCAEKFRNINMNDFKGSILPNIEGYGLNAQLQLDVQINKNDEERITDLWKGVLSKYVQLEKPKKTYQHYVKEVIDARKRKQKRPKLFIKTWQRKNAFQII